jgi:hypothetical protein
MTSKLLPCPLCGNQDVHTSTTGGGDERYGYNFTAVVRCKKCGCQKSIGSSHDKNGWCTESPEKVTARAADDWNTRTAPLSPDHSGGGAGAAADLNDAEEFEKWWRTTPVLRKGKLQIAQEAWKARASLDKVKELNQ